jgi:hypothetical protein
MKTGKMAPQPEEDLPKIKMRCGVKGLKMVVLLNKENLK